MTDAEALRALHDLVSALNAMLPGAESMGWDTGNAKTAISNSAELRARLTDPGYVRVPDGGKYIGVADQIRSQHNACMFKETCCSLLTSAQSPAEPAQDQLAKLRTKYEQLREIIDDGSESMTHDDAVAELSELAKLREHIPEWLCETCNTIHTAPTSFNISCKTPDCHGTLKPSTYAERKLRKRAKVLESNYSELLYQVHEKIDGQTRHETALARLRAHNNHVNQPEAASLREGGDQ